MKASWIPAFSALLMMVQVAEAQQSVADWQKEAVRRYPDLGVAGSTLNNAFREEYAGLQRSNPVFFDDPRWPLLLAERCTRENSVEIIPGLPFSPEKTAATPPGSSAAYTFTPPLWTPANGQVLFGQGRPTDSSGQLTVENGTSSGALVKLIDVARNCKVVTFFVGAQSTCRISYIPDGRYRLVFASGNNVLKTDWNKLYKPVGFSEFRDPFDFVTTEYTNKTEYSVLDVSLQPVVGGTAHTDSLSQEEFDKY